MKVVIYQCDKVARLFAHYLAIYNHVNGRIALRNFQTNLKMLPNTK